MSSPVSHALPDTLAVSGANTDTVELVDLSGAKRVAEIGIYRGHTSREIAKILAGRGGELHLFDFHDRVHQVSEELQESGCRIVTHGNTRLLMDNYNWSLMRLLQLQPSLRFDYVFLDGAHYWGIDALSFFLADRMLEVGGIMDFDDYDWSLANSPTLNPDVYPATADLHPADQIVEPQVKLIVDLLVRPDPRYEEVLHNKAFRKVSA